MFNDLPENSDHLRELREKLRQDSRDSFQLLENFWDNPICSIIHDEADHCIIVVWKQYATQIQLRYIHESLLALISRHRAYKILADDTALPAIASEDRFWIIDEWFPRAAECVHDSCSSYGVPFRFDALRSSLARASYSHKSQQSSTMGSRPV